MSSSRSFVNSPVIMKGICEYFYHTDVFKYKIRIKLAKVLETRYEKIWTIEQTYFKILY